METTAARRQHDAAVRAATRGQDEHEVFTFWPRHNAAIYQALENKHQHVEQARDEDDPLEASMVLNMGPQHPATHGVLRIVCQLDGETIEKCLLDIGYLHRGIEKFAEVKTYQEFMPYTDRMDYLSPYSNNVAWCLAVEKVANVEVPDRAQWLRTIYCELARISSHLLWMGTMVMDAGAISVFLWTFKYREEIYSIFDEVAGARFTVSHSRIGGLATDISDTGLAMIRKFCDDFDRDLPQWRGLLDRNRIWVDRNVGVGRITQEEALAQGFTGPNLRAVGIDYDIRLFEPYLAYDRVDFDIPMRSEGDSFARYFVRSEEMAESVKIIRQCLDRLPAGPVRVDNAKHAYPSKEEVYYSMEGMIHDFLMTDEGITPPPGVEAYHAVESPKGELGFHIVSDGTGSPWRIKLNSPSYCNLQGLEYMLEGAMVADTVVLIGSVDPVMGEADK